MGAGEKVDLDNRRPRTCRRVRQLLGARNSPFRMVFSHPLESRERAHVSVREERRQKLLELRQKRGMRQDATG